MSRAGFLLPGHREHRYIGGMVDQQTPANAPIGAGTVGTSDDGAVRVSFRREIPASIDQSWAALTDPTQMSTWLPGSEIRPEAGGHVCYDFGAEGQATGTVTSALPLNSAGPGTSTEMADLVEATDSTAMLEHTWRWEGLPDSTVLWQFQSTGSGTTVVLTHSAITLDAAVDFALGWHLILDTLERYVTGAAAEDNEDENSDDFLTDIIEFYSRQLG